MSRREVGRAMIIVAVLLGLIGAVWWARESDRADDEPSVSFLEEENVEPNRAGPLGAWGVGALLFLSGVIVLATTPTDERR